jgi:hypothetical protein
MPEGPEIDTDKLREQIDEEIEREDHTLVRVIAVTTAIFAALAAIASLQAGATVNEALVLKTEATQLQAQASDMWSYYQAKGVKGAVAGAALSSWRAAGKAPPPEIEASVVRYGTEQQAISDSAKAKERARDERSHEADELLHRHHGFAYSVALFQIAIALGAVAALTRAKPVLALSFLSGLGGLALFVMHYLR